MSRRHNGQRRRNYGRRQHEIGERRDGAEPGREWEPVVQEGDWTSVVFEREPHRLDDSRLDGPAR